MKKKIAYFDVFSRQNGFWEDYSINPKKYGGGAIFARWAKQFWNNNEKEFYIFASSICFSNLNKEDYGKTCVPLNNNHCDLLKKGLNLKTAFYNIDDFDVIMHGNTNFFLNNINCRAVQIHWAGFGHSSNGHYLVPYTFVFGLNEKSCYINQKIYPVKIGKPVPKEFKLIEKQDFIFQCGKHEEGRDSITIAEECIKNNIKCYFAGPISPNYPLLNYIDYKNTFYLGEITEEVKLEFSKRARLATALYTTGAVFNQSVIECLGWGTPILCNKCQWFDILIQHGINGFFYDKTNFLECWENAKNINQKKCWETAKQYSVEEMLRTFSDGIDFVIKYEHGIFS